MLSNNKQAVAYAHVQEAIDNWDGLLNVIWDFMLPEDTACVKAIGEHMAKAKEILDAG